MVDTESITRPEVEFLSALEVLKNQGKVPDEMRTREIAEWELDEDELKESPYMAQIHVAEMDDYILYVAVAKAETLKRMPPGTAIMSWSINTMPANEAVIGGSADTVEQAKRFAEIGYQVIYGGSWSGDA